MCRSSLRDPFKEDRRVLQNLGIVNTGLGRSHHIPSVAKSMNFDIRRSVEVHKRLLARNKAKRERK